jgi:hypothetical protein
MSDPSPFLSPALAAAAGGLYLTGEDNFRLTTWGALANAVVTLEGRIITPCGEVIPFVESQIPNSDRSAATNIFATCEGLLTNVQLRVSTGTAVGGTVAALLEIVRGKTGAILPLGTLLQGYANSATRLAWPALGIAPLTSGAGRLRAIVGTNPAPGVEILETVPTGARWQLRMFSFVLTASAVVANRAPVLTIDDGANVLWETGSAVLVTASQVATYRAGVGVPFFTYGTRAYHLPLPGNLWLGAGSRIRTVTGAIDAGDDYAAPIYHVEEFMEQ